PSPSLPHSLVHGPRTSTNATQRSSTLHTSYYNSNLVQQRPSIPTRRSSDLTGTLTTTPASTLTVQADGFFSSAFVNITHGFTNNSLIHMSAIKSPDNDACIHVPDTLTNAVGAIIRSSVGNGNTRALNAALDN